MRNFLFLLASLILFNCGNITENGGALHAINSTDVQSGFLEVPENRSISDGKTIKLAYTVLKAKDRTAKKDPILYLQGGPGGSTLFMSAFWENHELRKDRDIILMDQRGTGASNAICAEFGEKLIAVLAKDLTPQGELEEILRLTSLCKREAKEKGFDLSAYNSRENAADHEALRQHLGYDRWNLFGGSYGSRLALTIMRDFPKSVRSATIFGVFAPNNDLYAHLISNFKRSLFGVFQECENSSQCNESYPDLQKEFFEVLDSYDQSPYSFTYNGAPFVFNSQDILLMIHQMLYARQTMGQIPGFVKALKTKDDAIIRTALQPTLGVTGLINFAMYMSVNAYEEIPFNSTDAFLSDLKANPEFKVAPAFFGSDTRSLEEWHSFRASPYENEPVASEIPTLVANGNLDPITPPSNALKALESLSKAYYVEFEVDGHAFFNPCFFSIAYQFLEDPQQSPDFACAESKSEIRWD